MATVTTQIPRWMGFLFVIIALVFGYVWISTSRMMFYSPIGLRVGNPIQLIGLIIIAVIVGVAVYIAITGKAPVSYKIEK